MHERPIMHWTWYHWLALAISAGLWVALFYGIGALLYWIFFVLR